MQLSNLYINKIFKNCLNIQSVNGEIKLERFTSGQYKTYAENENFSIRSNCPAGVCIDLYTDSEYIRFKYKVMRKSRDWMYFDVYVDNIFVYSDGQMPIKIEDGEFYYELPSEKGKMKRLTIYIPQLVEITLRDIQISDSARIEEVNKPNKSLLCLGDSITQGMCALHPSFAYPVQLSRFLDMGLINQGVGGYVFDKESLDENIDYKPDIITVAYGTNDWGKCDSKESFVQNLTEYMDKLTNIFPQAKIFVITPIWRHDIKEAKNMGEFFELIETMRYICSNYSKVKIIDGLRLVPHMTSFFGDLTLHPSDEGFMQYSISLIKEICNTKAW